MLALLMQYAEVRPYFGCYEIAHALRPYLEPVAAGFGFGLVWATDRGWQRFRRRRGAPDRRTTPPV